MIAFFRQHRIFIIPVLFFIFALAFSALLPPAPVWITDSGNKYMVMQNFVERNEMYFEHPVPDFFHYSTFHFQQLDNGKIVSFFPAVLPALTATLQKIAGDFAICWIPLASALAILFAMQKMLPARQLPSIMLIAASPLFFYSVQLWEMLPAAAAVTLALWMLREKKYFLAGAIFGCGIWMREELYLLGAAFGIAMMCKRQWRMMWQFAIGAAIPVLLLWAVNKSCYGHILGIHGQTNLYNNRPDNAIWWQDVIFNYHQQLIRFDTAGKITALIIPTALATALTAGFAPSFTAWKPMKRVAMWLSSAAVITAAISLLRSDDPLFISGQTAGLFISFPLALPVLMNHRALCSSHLWWISMTGIACVIFILLAPPFLNRHDIGLTWGSRHYIVIMPLLTLLSFYSCKCSRWLKDEWKYFPQILMISGAVMQIWAATALYRISHRCNELENIIRKTPGTIVVSDLFFLPEMTPHIPQEKLWLEITDEQKTAGLLKLFERNNTNEFTLIISSSPGFRRLPNQALARLLQAYPPSGAMEKFAISPQLEIFVVKCAKKP